MWSCPEMKSVPGTHSLFLITIACIVFLILCPLPAAAIKVSGSMYTGSIATGSTGIHTMTISTNPNDPPMDLIVDVLGFGQTP